MARMRAHALASTTAASVWTTTCEQQLRDVELGRRNFLFAGSHAAAHRTAALYRFSARLRRDRLIEVIEFPSLLECN